MQHPCNRPLPFLIFYLGISFLYFFTSVASNKGLFDLDSSQMKHFVDDQEHSQVKHFVIRNNTNDEDLNRDFPGWRDLNLHRFNFLRLQIWVVCFLFYEKISLAARNDLYIHITLFVHPLLQFSLWASNVYRRTCLNYHSFQLRLL